MAMAEPQHPNKLVSTTNAIHDTIHPAQFLSLNKTADVYTVGKTLLNIIIVAWRNISGRARS